MTLRITQDDSIIDEKDFIALADLEECVNNLSTLLSNGGWEVALFPTSTLFKGKMQAIKSTLVLIIEWY